MVVQKTTYKTENSRIFAPSDIPGKTTGTQGISMTQEDIYSVVKAHGQAAKRVKESGFDAIELHAAHFYLLNQFLSPYYNHRTDEYGGRLENHIRFLKECYFDLLEELVGNLNDVESTSLEGETIEATMTASGRSKAICD